MLFRKPLWLERPKGQVIEAEYKEQAWLKESVRTRSESRAGRNCWWVRSIRHLLKHNDGQLLEMAKKKSQLPLLVRQAGAVPGLPIFVHTLDPDNTEVCSGLITVL